MQKSYPRFYNLNTVFKLHRSGLEVALMAECDAPWDELKEMTKEELRWSLIGNRHSRNESVIKNERGR